MTTWKDFQCVLLKHLMKKPENQSSLRKQQQYKQSSSSSLYPRTPDGSHVLVRVSESELTLIDRINVIISSLTIIGSVVWVPALYFWLYKRLKKMIKQYLVLCSMISSSHCADCNSIVEKQYNNIKVNRLNIINESMMEEEEEEEKYLQRKQQLTQQEQEQQHQNLQQQRNRLLLSICCYTFFVGTCTILWIAGPHRTPKQNKNEWLYIRKWNFISSWIRYVAMEVRMDITTMTTPPPTTKPTSIINNNYHRNEKKGYNNQSKTILLTDQTTNKNNDIYTIDDFMKQAILAFVPHGIFPFGFGFGFISELSQQIFGSFRPVVATATTLLPFLRDILIFTNKIDASTQHVRTAIENGDRIGINPGGIDEIFRSYPKPGTNKHTEYCIVRKGIFKLAYEYNIPVYPIYCFGATKMFKRLEIPYLETLSHYLRTSIVVFYGIFGLPIPHRQKLLYVIGTPITAPCRNNNNKNNDDGVNRTNQIIDEMHHQFCTELLRLFHRHKESYGWNHKTLEIQSR